MVIGLAAEVRALRAELSELKRLGRSGYTITMERKLAEELELAKSLRGQLLNLTEELKDWKRQLSETQAHLRSALDAGEAAERRIVELKAAGKGLCSQCGFPCRVIDETEELRDQLEVERMRLAACGVAAHGAGDEHFANMLPEYDSDALRATRALREELETARSAARHHADERAKLIDRLKRTDPFGGAGV